MPWLSHICNVAQFQPWFTFEDDVNQVLNDLEDLCPEARQFLDFYSHATVPHNEDFSATSTRAPALQSFTSSSTYLSEGNTEGNIEGNTEDNTEDNNISPSSTPPRSCTSSSSHVSTLDSVEVILAALCIRSTPPSSTTSPNQSSSFHIARTPIIPSELGFKYNPTAGVPSCLATVTPGLALYNSGTHKHQLQLPVVAVTQVPACTPLLPESTKICSPRAVAAALSDLFADVRLADPSRKDLASIRAVMKAMAHAVSVALLTKSGCAGITNGTQALIIRVSRIEDFHDDNDVCDDDMLENTDKRIVVCVSRMFETDWRQRTGVAHALVACMRAGFDIGTGGRLKKKDHNVKNKGNEMGQMDVSARTRECVVRVGNASPEVVFDDDEVLLSSLLRYGLCLGRSTSLFGEDNERREKNARIDSIIRRHTGVISVGSSDMVLRSTFDNEKAHPSKMVAVKLWNEADLDGLRDILDEIRMFKLLQQDRRYAHLLGEAIPRAFIWRDSPERDAVLVTEMEGCIVRHDGNDGGFYLHMTDSSGKEELREEVSESDAQCIVSAARRSLQMLHDCGICHGDVCLRNVRASRPGVRNELAEWKVLWGNLAYADAEEGMDGRDGKTSHDFDVMGFELERVDNLFSVDG